MAINETIVTGRKFRKCIDAVNKTWQRISFWTKSSDVEFEDGKNAETKLGAIDGITDSLVETSSRMAASAKAVSTLNNNLKGFTPILDSTGKITGYKTQAGADTVFPFKGAKQLVGSKIISSHSTNGQWINETITFDCTSVNGFKELSTNDFVCALSGSTTNSGSCGLDSVSATSYDSAGILTVKYRYTQSNDGTWRYPPIISVWV